MKYLSFVEEAVMNPKYEDWIGGRVEIWDDETVRSYAEREIRFITPKREDFRQFRNVWDFQHVNDQILKHLERKITKEYQQTLKNNGGN